jgi:DNA-directed RNA polymerase sigma subunit (sigma70/sigma32)
VLGFSVAASFEDIGRELGLSRQGAFYVYEQALRKLRARGGKQLREYLTQMMGER